MRGRGRAANLSVRVSFLLGHGPEFAQLKKPRSLPTNLAFLMSAAFICLGTPKSSQNSPMILRHQARAEAILRGSPWQKARLDLGGPALPVPFGPRQRTIQFLASGPWEHTRQFLSWTWAAASSSVLCARVRKQALTASGAR